MGVGEDWLCLNSDMTLELVVVAWDTEILIGQRISQYGQGKGTDRDWQAWAGREVGYKSSVNGEKACRRRRETALYLCTTFAGRG